MHLKKIALLNFKNISQEELALCPGINCLVGDNGAGKTNLLEAVHLCCLGRSHRTAFDREMIRAGQETAAVQVRVQRADGVDEVGVRLFENARRKKLVYVNGNTASRMGELMGHATCVIFSPEDLALVKAVSYTHLRAHET